MKADEVDYGDTNIIDDFNKLVKQFKIELTAERAERENAEIARDCEKLRADTEMESRRKAEARFEKLVGELSESDDCGTYPWCPIYGLPNKCPVHCYDYVTAWTDKPVELKPTPEDIKEKGKSDV